jgi:hypothetical protein
VQYAPAVQLKHAVALMDGWYEPGAQFAGAAALARQNLPPLGAHANAGNVGTTDVPAGQNIPAAHCAAADCIRLCEVPPRQNDPAAHVPHTLAPAAEKVPAGQITAMLAPIEPVNEPAGVVWHAEAPAALENEPTAHSSGAVLAAGQNEPIISHAWQVDAALALVDALNVPAAHATCCADAEPAGQ